MNQKPKKTRKSALASPKPSEVATTQTETGVEVVGRRRIPFARTTIGRYVVTTYGSQDASDHVRGITLLVKHERRGAVSWGTVANGATLDRGKASNKMQGSTLRSSEANNLFMAVRHVRHFPESIFNMESEYMAGRMILEAVKRDIISGDPSGIKIIQKCIEAAVLREEEETKADRIVAALGNVANRIGGIPTWRDLRDECESKGYPTLNDDNFRKDIEAAGLKWLIVTP